MGYKIKKAILIVAIIILVVLLGYFVYINKIELIRIAMPFFIALIIAYLLHPMVIRMERKKIKRGSAIILLYVFFILTIGSIIVFIIPEIISNTRELINSVPKIAAQFEGFFNGFMSSIKTSAWPDEFKQTVLREITSTTELIQNSVVIFLKRSITSMINTVFELFDIVLSLIIAYYFLKDAEGFKEGALSLAPRKWRNSLVAVGREIHMILSNFIQGQLLTALIVGILESIGLFAINAKYAIVLGMIGGIFNIIPYFGPFLGAIPAVIVTFIESPIKAFWAIIVFSIVQQIDNAFISPKIIEGKLGLHPVTTILAVLAGGEFFGIVGMLLAVPIFAILKVLFKHVYEAIV